jgi:MFS family permease
MRGLFTIWLGQMVSGIASSITSVALPIWIFSITESGTAVGILEFFFFSAYLLMVPFAGILIDRSNRKTMMLMYDFLSLFALTVLLLFQTLGLLEVWHLYVAAVFRESVPLFNPPLMQLPLPPWYPSSNIFVPMDLFLCSMKSPVFSVLYWQGFCTWQLA